MKFSAYLKIILSAFIASAAIVSLSASDKTGRREIGKVLFKNESDSEIMVFSSVETPSLYITKGSILEIVKGGKTRKFSVTDICGLYIRCRTESNGTTVLSGMKEGDTVYLPDSGNANVKYRDVKIVLASLIKVYEDFIFKIESVDEPSLISEYIEKFSADMEKIIPEMERLNSKYPELLKFYTEPPAELKYESDTLKLLDPALGNAFFKIKTYSEEPAVKRSLGKLQKVLEKMKKAGK